jgi:septal ring factor EnvC (AmiA/AmiB activator)
VPRRRVLAALVVLAALAAAVPAAFADLATQQASLDQRIDSLKSRIEEAKRRERVLTSDIDAA